jgi:hypothetical protein
MELQDFIARVISATKDPKTGEQFKVTFLGDEEFEQQDATCLWSIAPIIHDVINSKNLLSIEAIDELEDYLIDLEQYLKDTAN